MEKNKVICVIGPLPPPIGGMALQTKELAKRLKNENLRVFLVKTNYNLPPPIKNFKGFKTIINFLIYFKNIAATIPKSDVIFIMACSHLYFFLHVYPAFVLGKKLNKKIIISFRGGAPQKFFSKYQKTLRNIFTNVRLIVPSNYLKGVFIEYFNLNPTVIPNIAYIEKFKFKGFRKLKPLFLCSRNFEPYYGVENIIAAFDIIKDKFSQARLGLIGDGSLKKLILKEIKKRNLTNKIKLYGRLEHNLLPNIYHNYDIYLNASRVDNFPGSLIEAFASGLLVITSNAGGIPFIVKDNETGLLVPIDDPKTMAQKACYILENQDKGMKIIKKAREEAEKYSWNNIKKDLLPLLLD